MKRDCRFSAGILFVPAPLHSARTVGRWLAAALLLLFASFAPALGHKQPEPDKILTLVEVANYQPCNGHCSEARSIVTAFCFLDADRHPIVAESRHVPAAYEDDWLQPYHDLADQKTPLPVRFHNGSLLIDAPPLPPAKNFKLFWLNRDNLIWRSHDLAQRPHPVKLSLGSRFEDFQDAGCAQLVRKAILNKAEAVGQPVKVPVEAIAITTLGKGDPYIWIYCRPEPAEGSIGCQKWYRNGDAMKRSEFYCARTITGTAVGADFHLDPLLSREGQLVVGGTGPGHGEALVPDLRNRNADKLDNPRELCH